MQRAVCLDVDNFFTSWRKIIFLIASIVIYLVNPVYSGDKYGKSSDMGKNSSHRFYIDDLKWNYKKSGISAASRIVTAIFGACLRSS
ncbi:hypothetical protein SB96558_1085 [Shigella boydii 965-58]|nr:hypothetical protein SB96558_1085 [Shigella boydii 965-58]